MSCDPGQGSGPEAELVAAVRGLGFEIDRWVLAPPDRVRDLRTKLGAGVHVVATRDPALPLDVAATEVIAVPGRCVVLAAPMGDAEWAWVTTPGSLVAAPSTAPRPAPGDRGITFGGVLLGARLGWPALAGFDGTVFLGPVTATVGGWPRLSRPWVRDGWFRGGLVVPVTSRGGRVLSIGPVAGWRQRLVRGFDERAGPSFGVEGAWTSSQPNHVLVQTAVTLGVDLIDTPFRYALGSHLTGTPVLELSIRVGGGSLP